MGACRIRQRGQRQQGLAAMPLTLSIAQGTGIGVIACAEVKVTNGKGNDCPPAVYVIALLFVLKFALRVAVLRELLSR